MPVPDKVYLSTPSDTYTSAIGVTGEIREHIHPTYGKQYYRMVKNTSGSDIAANLVVVFASGSSVNVALSAGDAPSHTVAGVTQNIIPNGSFGWVCCGGDCKVTAAADTAANASLVATGSAGKVDDPAISSVAKAAAVIGVGPNIIDISVEPTGIIRLSGLM
tara:strand:+ start:10069 stop:10554 length:486 start_codon:yes stop_codon:yes gene_type:complete